MAWNQPGGSGNNPWGKRPAKDGRNVDEAFRNFQRKLEALVKGGGGPGGQGGAGGGDDAGGPDKLTVLAGVAIAVAIWTYMCFFTVAQAERGVVQRFGAFVSIREPGLGWHFWPLERVTMVNTQQVSSVEYKARVLTQDLNLIDMALAVQYQLRDPARFLFQVKQPEQTLREVSESAIREVVGRSNLETIFVSNREQVTTRTRELIQRTLDQYNTGIAVTSVNLTDVQVPEAVVPSQRDANKAIADKERLTKEAEAYASGILPVAEGAALRQIQEAEGYRAQVVAIAEGEAARFDQLVAAYEKSPRVTRERLYIDAVESVMTRSRKVIVDTKGGNGQMLYLPLDKLVERGAVSRENEATVSAQRPTPEESQAQDSRQRGER
ncbi:MAG: FtsH protease activity modulator HflK [Steroidobacteraceae bacterium]|jgi:membrane protease subunit HflK|nr:FtsH protease activity modulator HflK [Steroidobacteraceae bacterium]